jgi:class 3 adenylate cyclase/tetratricopeptide (TPR) repeat protein
MQCSRCQQDNPPQARFCMKCGASVALTCGKCSTELPAGAAFCFSCGQPVGTAPAREPRFTAPESYTPRHLAQKILISKAALEGERKQVTVLFADLKGSMELLADRDPEEARKILDPVLELMMEAVHRYEGTVNQVMGDGIMALFGAPLAHEDHAVRACYAALRMQERASRHAAEARRTHGANVKIRVGLNSGEVVVRAIGSDLHMDYTAVGQTTHLAARMEQLADPGAIVITPDTLTLVEGLVAVTSLGPVPVKGLAEPLEVFEVTGVGAARTRLHAAARRGLTRFVGRDNELNQLWRAQELAGKGRGQVAAVVGEAGVGKSRLVYEFMHSHRLQGWLVLEAASVSYGKATSYLPAIALLKSYFKIHDRDDQREVREKVTGKLLALDRALEPSLPALLSLLDVPVEDPGWQTMAPLRRRQQTLDGVKSLLLREAREQPLVVVFEDLHWIDGETQALLDGLVESLGSARLLLLVNYRPEYQHGWAGKTYYSQLRLDALPPASAADLLEELLGEDASLGPLKQLLVKRGNPFFVEETVRTLMETGALAGERGHYRLAQPVGAIQIPPTVQVMLAARIDRLSLEAKRLLQVASVIGKDVPFVLLREIAEEPEEQLQSRLAQLQAAEFLHETALFPDLEYSFKHALTHEVTYGGLLQERRRALHARIVEAIEQLHADRLGEQIERLAHHAALGGLGDKAVEYLRQAGLKAAGRSALRDARIWFEQAVDILRGLPESRSNLEKAFDVRFELRPVLMQMDEPDTLLERLREAESIAERLNDAGRLGRFWTHIAWSYRQRGELDASLAASRRALEIADRQEDRELRIESATGFAQTHYHRGDLLQAIEFARNGLAALPPELASWAIGGASGARRPLHSAVPLSINFRYTLIWSLSGLGRFGEAAACEAEATQLAEKTQHAFTIASIHHAAIMLHIDKGDWSKAQSRLEGVLAVARTADIKALIPVMVANSALVLAQLGERGEAANRLREAEELVEQQVARGSFFHVAWIYHALGRACLLLGRIEDAQRLAERATEEAATRPVMAPVALWLLADIASHPDRLDLKEGERRYREALMAAEAQGRRPVIAHCHLGLGKLYRRMGNRQEAQEHLETATTMYRDMDMRFYLEQAEAELRGFA